MKAEELRIGNYVLGTTIHYEEEEVALQVECKVTLLCGYDTHENTNMNVLPIVEDENFEVPDEWDYINPIPLTEEWLFRFGFVNNGATYSKPDHIVVSHDLSTVGIYSERHGDDLEIDCPEYVHQLQNLLYVFGEELTLSAI